MNLAIGKAITHFRERVGITKAELAEKTGLSPSSITQYENGNRNPTEDNLILIADALSISVEKIKNTAEQIYNQGPIIDDYRLRRKLDVIHSNNDLVVELSKYVLLGIRANVHDLVFETSDTNSRRIGFARERNRSPIQVIVEKVMREYLNDHIDEIAYRIQDEMKRTEITVDDIIENIRNNDLY